MAQPALNIISKVTGGKAKDTARAAGQFLDQLKVEITEKKKQLAKVAVKSLFWRSPVWAGHYVKSHRVSLNFVDSSFSPYIELAPQFWQAAKLSGPAALALKKALLSKAKLKIARTGFKDDIFISNSIPYSDQVEYLGWLKTPAHHPYGHTQNALIIAMRAMR
jgi:hypothetical protein